MKMTLFLWVLYALTPIVKGQSVDSINIVLSQKSIDAINIRDINFNLNYRNKEGSTLLMYLCIHGKNINLIRNCLEMGADIYIRDSLGYNSINYITFPSLYESKLLDGSDRKNLKDMEAITRLFIKYHPIDSISIQDMTIENLIKFHDVIKNKYFLQLITNKFNRDKKQINLKLIDNKFLFWVGLDSNLTLKFNNYYIDSTCLTGGKFSLFLFDTLLKIQNEEFVLNERLIGECDRNYTDFIILNSTNYSPKIILIQEEYKNDCTDDYEVNLYKLEFFSNKIRKSKIN